MLILTRRVGETLMVGDEENLVTLTVLGVKGNQVRIGVNAPKNIPVHREEIYQKIQREKQQHASGASDNVLEEEEQNFYGMPPGDYKEDVPYKQQGMQHHPEHHPHGNHHKHGMPRTTHHHHNHQSDQRHTGHMGQHQCGHGQNNCGHHAQDEQEDN